MKSAWILLWLAAAPAASQGDSPRRISGATVRSNSWTLHDRGKREEFKGNVRYRKDGDRIWSRWAQHDRMSKQWTFKGEIRLHSVRKDGSIMKMSKAHTGTVDEKTRRGKFKGGPEKIFLTWENSSGTYHARSRRVEVDDKAGLTLLIGDAEIWGPDRRAWAGKATFLREGDRLLLEKRRPIVRSADDGNDTAFQADKTTLFRKEKRIEARGRVIGWLSPAEKK